MSSIEYFGPFVVDERGGLTSDVKTIGGDFSTAVALVPPDLLLFVLLFSFSPFPAIVKSAA